MRSGFYGKFVMVLVLAVLGAASAQQFVLVSNRMKAEPDTDSAGMPHHQNELFVYQDGSQLRLTFTLGENEWDPEPSPSGRYIAYLVSDEVPDWTDQDIVPDWNWLLRIMDIETRLVLEEWQLPGSPGATRYAGGFDIAWSADEQWLLVQLPDDGGQGRIGRVDVGDPEVREISRGYGISLQSELGLIATTIDGYATVLDQASGQQHAIQAGEAIGWVGTGMIIGGEDQLLIYDYMDSTMQLLSDTGDYYVAFTSSRDGTRHAWLSYLYGDPYTDITVVDSSFETVAAWAFPDYVSRIDFIDPRTLLLSFMISSNRAISAVDLDSYIEYPLVSTIGFDNFSGSVLPPAP